MDRFRGWAAGLIALALCAAGGSAAAQAFNKERFWQVGADGEYCAAVAQVDGGAFVLSVDHSEVSFSFAGKGPVAKARRGVLELGPYAFDFTPAYDGDVVYMDDALNEKAMAALARADGVGLRLDGREIVSMALEGTGFAEAMQGADDCSNNKDGWWGKGATPHPEEAARVGDSSGTGFFIAADGVGVTNAHVVEGCKTLTSPRWGDVTLMAVDKVADLAVFKTQRAGPNFVALRGRGPRLGEPLTVAGYPLMGILGDGVRITTGVVSALSGMGGDRSFFQMSAPVQPGNSGGPVIDSGGALIGVTVARAPDLEVAKATGGALPQNINFGVPVTVLQSFLDENGVAAPTKPPAQAGVDAMPLYTFSLLCKGGE